LIKTEGWQGALEVKEQLPHYRLLNTWGMPQSGKATSYTICDRSTQLCLEWRRGIWIYFL